MSKKKKLIEETTESVLDMKSGKDGSGEKDLTKALYNGVSAPMTKVILRMIPIFLLVAAIAIFVTAIMRFNELEREREVLEEKIEKYEYEIEELHYLIDSPVDYDYIVRVAREKLGLHLPDEIVYYNDYNGSK